MIDLIIMFNLQNSNLIYLIKIIIIIKHSNSIIIMYFLQLFNLIIKYSYLLFDLVKINLYFY